MNIRHATLQDLPAMTAIYERARRFMAEHGNPNQWGPTNWPPEALLREDIAAGDSYVCVEDGRVVGTFFFRQGEDVEPTYRVITDGCWLDDSTYGIVHRIATDGSVKGVGQFCVDWAYAQCGHLRMDTHGDNVVMQNLLQKCGFVRCGTIYVEEDEYPRLAYEKVRKTDFVRINTGGITYLERMDGTDWQWGSDYASGDLYEAEELYRGGHPIRKNRLVFIRCPEPKLYEPLTARDGQYFGRPCFFDGRIYLLLADFPQQEILIYRCAPDMASAEAHVRLPLDTVPDCYNLMLHAAPLTLTRQGHENTFQVVWPERGSFAIDPSESLDSRDGDRLLFSKWYEDPAYREELVVRRYPTGEVMERADGTLMTLPDGQRWLFV